MNSDKRFIYRKALGTSPLLLFIHGAGCDYTFWNNMNRYFFYKKFSTLSISLPGHGENIGKPLASIEKMANYISKIVKKFTNKNVIPIGHSMGSLICLALASKKLINIEKMILIGTALPMRVSSILLYQSEKEHSKAINNMVNWGLPSEAKLSGGNISGLSLPNCIYNLMKKNKKNVLFSDLTACNSFSLEDSVIKKIMQPVLIISGDKDIMTSKKNSINLKNNLNNSEIEILAECGHFHTFEHSNKVRKIITNFLEND